MSDLNERLRGLLEPATTTEHTVAQDLRRARTARRRRSLRLTTAALGLVAVGGVGTVAVVSAQQTPPAGDVRAVDTPTTGSGGATSPTTGAGGPTSPTESRQPLQNTPASQLRLVAYTGEQPAGFEVAVVPDGFVLQGSSPNVLAVARPDDRTSINEFAGKIVVSIDGNGLAPHGDPVRVGEYDGWMHHDGATQMLSVQRGDVRLAVQAWGDLGLSDAQVIEFAEGVTITDAAQPSVG